MTVTVLGTSAAVPAHGRALSATLVEVPTSTRVRRLLLDCGEGTQLRLAALGHSPLRLDAVCITHLHGDHLYGLPGLLGSMAMAGRVAPLTVVGPEGLADWLAATPGADPARLPFALDVRAWPEGNPHAPDALVVWSSGGVAVTAVTLDHRVPTRGYRVETASTPGNLDVAAARALGVTDWADFRALKAGEAVVAPGGRRVEPHEVVGPPVPGVALAYVLDTRPCDGARLLAAGADLVVHDATFADADAARADATGHSTARGAATVARDAGARRLLLTHISARYPDAGRLVGEARAVFEATEAATEGAAVRLRPHPTAARDPSPEVPGADVSAVPA